MASFASASKPDLQPDCPNSPGISARQAIDLAEKVGYILGVLRVIGGQGKDSEQSSVK
jgi:hypothetical protein